MKDEELELILPEKCSPQIWKNLTLGCCSLVELETSIACAACAICRNGNGAVRADMGITVPEILHLP